MVKSISLPAPAILSAPLKDALSQRRTNRECSSEALTDAELAALLWASAGITADDGRRTTPSTLDLRVSSSTLSARRPLVRRDHMWTQAQWGKAAILPPHHLDSQAASGRLLTMMNCARP